MSNWNWFRKELLRLSVGQSIEFTFLDKQTAAAYYAVANKFKHDGSNIIFKCNKTSENTMRITRITLGNEQKLIVPKCDTCKFYVSIVEHHTDIGHCKRRAPVRFVDDVCGVFPVVSNSDWCGEFVHDKMV